MRQRGITEKDIEYCLQHYDTSMPDRAGNTKYVVDLPSGRRIAVVIGSSNDSRLVITAEDYS